MDCYQGSKERFTLLIHCYGINRFYISFLWSWLCWRCCHSIGADGIVKDRAVETAKDKAGDFAKGKVENDLSKKIANKRKSKFKEADRTDKYWYLKDNK